MDLIAASSGGSKDWAIYPEHIAERHGLIVIVGLGESLIVAAGGLVDEPLNFELLSVGVISVILACELWWSYFVKSKTLLDKAIEATYGPKRAQLTRDAFSLAHFPMVAGIIGFALTIEAVIAHPNNDLPFEIKVTLAGGLFLFTGGTALAVWRATEKILFPRIILISIAGILILSGIIPVPDLLIALVFLTTILIIENSMPTEEKMETVKIT